ncbi:MAG: phage holin family protein, partial [Bacteroidia bacterium]|nr:phage holin family protein [Bacteroidia bacterium]
MNSFKLKMDVFELAAAAAGGYLVLFFDKYLAPNGLFALALMLLVAADTVSGVAASIKEKTFSSKEMARPLRKIAIYMLTLLPLHVLADALPPGPVKEIINTGDGLAYAYICV